MADALGLDLMIYWLRVIHSIGSRVRFNRSTISKRPVRTRPISCRTALGATGQSGMRPNCRHSGASAGTPKALARLDGGQTWAMATKRASSLPTVPERRGYSELQNTDSPSGWERSCVGSFEHQSQVQQIIWGSNGNGYRTAKTRRVQTVCLCCPKHSTSISVSTRILRDGFWPGGRTT